MRSFFFMKEYSHGLLWAVGDSTIDNSHTHNYLLEDTAQEAHIGGRQKPNRLKLKPH